MGLLGGAGELRLQARTGAKRCGSSKAGLGNLVEAGAFPRFVGPSMQMPSVSSISGNSQLVNLLEDSNVPFRISLSTAGSCLPLQASQRAAL